MKRSTRFVALATGFELSLAVLAMLIGPWFACEIADEISRPFGHLTVTASVTHATKFVVQTAFFTLPMVAGLAIIVRSELPAFANLKRVVEERFLPILKPLSAGNLCLIGCAAGFGEEMLFRGFMQTALGQYFPQSPSLAIGAVAVLFGSLHLVTPTYGVLATIAGAYLGWLYHWTGNLWIPIGVHATYDVVALCWIVRTQKKNGPAN